MSDNKALRGHPDKDLFNKNEAYEVESAINTVAREFPDASRADIKKALMESAKVPNFHHNRQMIINSTKLKVKNL